MLNYNMIPIVQDHMNDIGSRINILTSVSSNAYYGYQPQIYLEGKHFAESSHTDQRVNNNVCNGNMDIQFNNNNNSYSEAMQTENIPRQVNRKRRWDSRDEFIEFKKRRQTENNNKGKRKNVEENEQHLLEEILRETHGVNIYHWYCNEV